MPVVDVVKKTYVDAQNKKLGFPIVIDNADRAVQFPAPVLNQRVHNISTGDIEQWDGAVWITEFEGTGGVKTRWNTKAAGLVADSVTDEYVKFNTLVNAAMQPAGGTVEMVGVIVIGTNMSIPKNVTLKYINGAYLSPLGGINITFNGKMVGDTRKRFGGAGTVTFGRISTRFRPEWWGAIGDNVANDTVSFQNCSRDVNTSALALTAGATVRLGGTATYNITDTVNLNQHRVHWEGAKKYSSQISFNPAAPRACFKLQHANPALVLYQCSVTNISFVGAGVEQKIAIDLYDQSETKIEGNTTIAFTGNSGSGLTPSIALRTKGREWLLVHDNDFSADRPIHITRNTNAPSLSADHFTFSKNLLYPQVATESSILIDGDCGVSALEVRNCAWVGGKYGLRALSGVGLAALGITLYNNRFEQPADLTGFAVDWQISAPILNIISQQFGGVGSPTNGGLRVRNVTHTRLLGCFYTGSGAAATALDIDATCRTIRWSGCFWQDSCVVSMPGFEELEGLSGANTLSPLKTDASWFLTAAGAPIVYQNGQPTYKKQIVLAAGGGLYTLKMSGVKAAKLRVAGWSVTGPVRTSGSFAIDGTGSTVETDVYGNLSAVNIGARLCTIWNNVNNIQLINNLAQPITLLILEEWAT